MFVIAFYVVSPIPTVISGRYNAANDFSSGVSVCSDVATFLTAVIVVSAYGLPVVLCTVPFAASIVRVFVLYSIYFLLLLFSPITKSLLESPALHTSPLLVQIHWGAAVLVCVANTIIFGTIFAYFLLFTNPNEDAWMPAW